MPKTFGPTERPQRFVPYRGQAGACSLRVPIETPDEGEWHEGRFQIPSRLVEVQEHTNDALEFLRIVKQNADKWTDWKAQKGLFMVPGTLAKTTPYPNPGKDADPDTYTVSLFARFKRHHLMYMGLDDFLENERLKKAYGIKEAKVAKNWNDVSGTEDTGWVDPLKEAAESRKRQGLKLEDYRLPDWWQAESEGRKWSPK